MSLGLNQSRYVPPVIKEIRPKMMTPCDHLHGFEVSESIGLVEVVVEKGFTSSSLAGIRTVHGGALGEMIEDARFALANLAAERGANSVIGLRYEISGRELEKAFLRMVLL